MSLPNSKGTSPDRLLNRIDIHVEVSLVGYGKLDGDRMGETSESIRKRVQAAREIQNKCFGELTNIVCNAGMRIAEVSKFCHLQDGGQSLMRVAMSQLNLPACAYRCILKLLRTMADLVGSKGVQATHLAEALQYKPKLMLG